MRIISGKHKGRKIEVAKKSTQVRPTSGFTREAIFNIISHGNYFSQEGLPFEGKTVADICCGSGAFGLEALSRGAEHVTFVDMDHYTLLNAKENAERLGEAEHVSFIRANATDLPAATRPYHLIFIDPPYFSKLIPDILKSLTAKRWVNQDTLVIIEHDSRERPDVPPHYSEVDERRYGRASVRLLQAEKQLLSEVS